jgi:hypothetical protein
MASPEIESPPYPPGFIPDGKPIPLEGWICQQDGGTLACDRPVKVTPPETGSFGILFVILACVILAVLAWFIWLRFRKPLNLGRAELERKRSQQEKTLLENSEEKDKLPPSS